MMILVARILCCKFIAYRNILDRIPFLRIVYSESDSELILVG